MKRRSDRPAVDRSIIATGEFARLAYALDRNDYATAAADRAALSELGYTVKARIGPPHDPDIRPYKPSAGKGVGE